MRNIAIKCTYNVKWKTIKKFGNWWYNTMYIQCQERKSSLNVENNVDNINEKCYNLGEFSGDQGGR